MTSEQISSFFDTQILGKVIKVVNIAFRTRNPIRGIFLNVSDFEDLKSKNFWRIITEDKIEDWNKTKSMGLSRIYNGSDITKLKL